MEDDVMVVSTVMAASRQQIWPPRNKIDESHGEPLSFLPITDPELGDILLVFPYERSYA